ncbi:MAG: dienelactone hydrolase family protein [Candidatus Dependentiae bacterium]|nr:dienelactone hydrolase family protein [Candidatus Dependentiae bacterium]
MTNASIQLPEPTGFFNVGTTTYHWIDTKRKEMHADNAEHPYRELMVQVWYPAQQSTGKKADYMPPRVHNYIQDIVKKATATTWQGVGYITQNVATNSYKDVPIASENNTYPVIIFSHGFASINYVHTSFCEELASHGYIVIAPNHTYIADPVEFADGRIIGLADSFKTVQPGSQQFDKAMYNEIDVWIDDIKFILDELEKINNHDAKNILTHRLNVSAIGMVGHSFGGMTAHQVCSLDTRIKAGVDMDGALYGNLNRDVLIPFMYMYVEPQMLSKQELEMWHMQEEDYVKFIQDMRANITKLSASLKGDAYIIKFIQGDHMTFSDYLLLKHVSKPTMLNPLRGIEITRALLVDFFDKYLKGETAKVLNAGMVTYPEITIERK